MVLQVVVSGHPAAADGPARRVLTAAPMADAGAELARVIHATIERFRDSADSARVDEIVTAMAQFGITTLDSLRIILDDAGSRGALSVALGDAVKPAFPFLLLSVLKVRARVFARVRRAWIYAPAHKSCVIRAQGAALHTTPPAAVHPPTAGAHAPSPADTRAPAAETTSSVIVSVKERCDDRTVVIASRATVTISEADTFAVVAERRLAHVEDDVASRLRGLPLEVMTYPNHACMPSQAATASGHDVVINSVRLKHEFVVLTFTDTGRSSSSVQAAVPPTFARMAVAQRVALPAKYASSDDSVRGLTYDLMLFNALVDHASELHLGVDATDVDSCCRLFLAVRDVLQIIEGREAHFSWSKVCDGWLALLPAPVLRSLASPRPPARRALSGDATLGLRCTNRTVARARLPTLD